MVKTFAFTFSINGLVSQSFSGSMNAARNGLLKLRQQGKDLQGQLKELDAALYKNEIDFEGYAQKANKVKAELKALELQQTKLNNVISAKNNLKGAVTDLGIFSMGVTSVKLKSTYIEKPRTAAKLWRDPVWLVLRLCGTLGLRKFAIPLMTDIAKKGMRINCEAVGN